MPWRPYRIVLRRSSRVGLAPVGRRGELEDPLAIVARPGVEERRPSGRRRRPRRRGSAGSAADRGRSRRPAATGSVAVARRRRTDRLDLAVRRLSSSWRGRCPPRAGPTPAGTLMCWGSAPKRSARALRTALELGLVLELGRELLALDVAHRAGVEGVAAAGQGQGEARGTDGRGQANGTAKSRANPPNAGQTERGPKGPGPSRRRRPGDGRAAGPARDPERGRRGGSGHGQRHDLGRVPGGAEDRTDDRGGRSPTAGTLARRATRIAA